MAKAKHLVVALVYDGLGTFEFGITVEVFGLPRPEFDFPWYRFAVCQAEKGRLHTVGGFRFDAPGERREVERADTIILPGWRNPAKVPPSRMVELVKRAYDRGIRLVSICGGVFVMAAAGILDGRRVTTHWLFADELKHRYPRIDVDPNALYIDEGQILTSAGSAAGIDLCLHIVRKDYGAEVANQVARRLISQPYREGGQSQFIEAPVMKRRPGPIAELLDWLGANLSESLAVAQMACHAHMSERSLLRHFKAATGMTPKEWLWRERVRRSQRLLETSKLSVEVIAGECGFGSTEAFRYHFRRVMRTSPRNYRLAFSLTSR